MMGGAGGGFVGRTDLGTLGGVTGCAALPAPLPDPAGAETRLPLPVPMVAF